MTLVKSKNIHRISDKNAEVVKMSKNSRAVIADGEIKTMAENIFGKLLENGCKTNDIINISSQLIELISSEMISDRGQRQGVRANVSTK